MKGPKGEIREAKNAITVENLFTMTAGFNYNLQSAGYKKAAELTDGRYDTVETIRCVAQDPLDFEPGTHWQYSICHDVLAALVSVISGQKFRDYVKENIFDPLDMKDSVYHHTPETLARTAQQYSFVANGQEVIDFVEAQKYGNSKQGYFKNVGKGVDFVPGEEYDSGGAGIITTVSDYAKLAAALAGRGLGANGERILSPYSVDLMRVNRLSPELLHEFNWKQLAGYGYGLGVRTLIEPARADVICGHGEFGWGGAAGSSTLIDAQIGLAVFYAQHTLNPREEYYQPRLKNVVYEGLE